jgi:hypothetical protein
MKLQYRGNSYEHNPQLIETPESKVLPNIEVKFTE